jgi:hypothetical protein
MTSPGPGPGDPARGTFALAGKLGECLAAFRSDPGKDQLASLLDSAVPMRLDRTFVEAASETLRLRPATVERCLDLVRLPHPVAWIEFHDAHRGGPRPQGRPDAVGALAATYPGDPRLVAVVTAWSYGDGAAHHSPAAMRWNLAAFRRRAAAARAPERMLSLAEAAVPPWNDADLDCFKGGRAAAEREALRAATSEHLFLLSALLLAAAGAPGKRDGGGWELSAPPATGASPGFSRVRGAAAWAPPA